MSQKTINWFLTIPHHQTNQLLAWFDDTLLMDTDYEVEVIEPQRKTDILSVSVLDADADTDAEIPVFGEPDMPTEVHWNNNLINVLLSYNFSENNDNNNNNNNQNHELQKSITTQTLKTLNCGLIQEFYQFCTEQKITINAEKVELLDDQDWVRLTQSQFEPIWIQPQNDERKMCIVPSWHEIPKEATITLELDPGLAFGTGSHPTTHLCLEWLLSHQELIQGKKVIDYGCGSGILALAAAKLGASSVQGTDIDKQAIISSRENAIINQVFNVQWFDGEQVEQLITADCVVANILSIPLKMLAPTLSHLTSKYLVLSGVLARQADDLIATYSPYISLKVWQEKEGWVCLIGEKN
jgi:ribosomal protein L11 methyltransferase